MRTVWWTFNSTRRRRWASWLALALLVALVGGTVLAGVSAARRTSTAFPSFNARYGGDVAEFSAGAFPKGLDHYPGARHVFTVDAYANGNVSIGSTFIPEPDFSLLAMPSDWQRAFRLVSGRLPTAPGDVLAGFSLAQQAHLHVGSIVKVPLYAKSQAASYYNTSGYLPPTGPVAVLRVVGISAGIFDFPSNAPSYSLIADSAFAKGLGEDTPVASVTVLRLAGGAAALPRFEYVANHLPGSATQYPFSIVTTTQAVESSIQPQVVAWWLFALIAAIAGMALVGQALSRQSIVERATFPTLSAVGVTPSQLFWLGMARAFAIGLVGTAGAVGLAVALSPLTPVGEARAAELQSGLVLDGPVLGLGAVAVLAVVLALALFPSWRASNARLMGVADNDVSRRRSSVAAGVAARAGASTPMVIGIRHALERGRGRGAVPVTAALFGTIAAVAALVGAAVFGTSLTNLLATPRLYGQTWQLDLANLTGPQAAKLATQVAAKPGVTDVTYGLSGKLIDVNGVPVNVEMGLTAKGPPVFGIVAGREPTGIGEIALGTQTLDAAHAHIGSTATMSIIAPGGKTISGPVRVVGEVAFPPVIGAGGLGNGAVMALPAVLRFACGDGPAADRCRTVLNDKIEGDGFTDWGLLVAVAPTPQGRAVLASLEQRLSNDVNVITAPINLVNFGASVNFPELLGLTLALFGVATLLHLLLVSVARRRRELAVLKVLGFVRLQVRAAVCWQALTIGVVGIVVGLPVGIAIGHVAWGAFVHDVGAIPSTVVPVGQLAVIGAAVVVVGLLLALLPSTLASNVRPAVALREQ
jgi:hypothetical protein